jgi:hypothetical protein
MLPNNEVRVSRPRIAQPAVPRDITAEFTEAASSKHITLGTWIVRLTGISAELNTGQLVKDETFTLFEAVGALEVRQLFDRETCDENCG